MTKAEIIYLLVINEIRYLNYFGFKVKMANLFTCIVINFLYSVQFEYTATDKRATIYRMHRLKPPFTGCMDLKIIVSQV